MKELNINRDTNQPTDEALLKHQNFEEVVQKANIKSANTTGNLVTKKWWYISVAGFVVLGVFVLTINSVVTITNQSKKTYIADSQSISLIEKFEENVIAIQNNNSTIEMPAKTIIEKQENSITDKETKEPELTIKPIEYYYPKEASTLTFKLDEAFGLKNQYQQFEEFAIYDNLAFQPIGDYQSGWLKASWTKVELVKKSGNYFLMLSKNGGTFPCQVVPVFESEEYIKALEVYTKTKM